MLSAKIIDAHQHFWNPARGDYAWLDDAPAMLKRIYGPKDLMPSLISNNVESTILVQAAPTVAETKYLLSIAARTPFIAGVVGWLDFDAEGFDTALTDLRAEGGLIGIRPMLHDLPDPSWILRPRVLRSLHALVNEDLPLDVVCRPDQLPIFAQALRCVPGLRAVIDHLGSPELDKGKYSSWADSLAEVAEYPDVYCKVSGLGALSSESWNLDDLCPAIGYAVSVFGADRLIWGSDWPVSLLNGNYDITLEVPMAILKPLLKPMGLAAVFGGNAATLYKLS